MNIKDLKDSLDYLFKAQLTPFVWGHAGVGKTSTFKQYAQDKGYKFFAFYLGTQSDIGDILGLQGFVKDENGTEVATQFAIPLWIKEVIEYCNNNPDSGAVIFLDEFNRGRRDILSGMFSLALDKTFHTLKLPKNCYIAAAGNPPTDEYFTTDIGDTALLSRFVHIKLEPTFQEWVEYAKSKEMEPTLIEWLQEQPELIADAKSEFVLPVKVDNRAIERANALFKVGTPGRLLDQLLMGIVGVERLTAYKAFLKRSDKPLTGAQALSGEFVDKIKEWSNPANIKASLISITCDNVYDTFIKIEDLPNTEAEKFVELLETLPLEASYKLMQKIYMHAPVIKTFDHLHRHSKLAPRLEKLMQNAIGNNKKTKTTT